jgi:hypothetical protein
LKTEKILNEGYGNCFGFSNTVYWASATAGLLHVWKEFDIISSYEIPGFEKGNIIFKNDTLINVGLFEVNFQTREKKYRSSIVEKFALYCEDGRAAHYSQYKIQEVLHTKEDIMLISIAYQPSKRNKTNTTFNGPTNRLLLFEHSGLTKVIAENYDSSFYSNLFLLKNRIIFTKDDGCYVVEKDKPENQALKLNDFIPLYHSETDNVIVGSFNNNYIQFRDLADLKLVKQLSESFTSVNNISGYDNTFFLAVNENEFQVWQNITDSELYKEKISLDGIIEAVAFNNENNCFIALAGTENKIVILSIE